MLAVPPLLDDGFAAALAAHRGRLRCPSRRELLASIPDTGLPPLILARRDKATFDEVFFRAATREFVREWDGSGVDGSLVDVDALRREWSGWPVSSRTAALVQQAWLATRPPPHPPFVVPQQPTVEAPR
ncbi:hypothetical protein GA0070558_14513 [Micromonospora haikouensis]|uniref:Uncharacterized protein n=1 Tax=Micromonospora haikouensis TaxID=686309 RepID=A0A1C4YFV0_9ACTN|nr:hypothetical protein [Micromonospora haikouensis]SCF19593.1 hypothetical protein GA0070558_14513 [Micromonospora haikouensis]